MKILFYPVSHFLIVFTIGYKLEQMHFDHYHVVLRKKKYLFLHLMKKSVCFLRLLEETKCPIILLSNNCVHDLTRRDLLQLKLWFQQDA